MADPSEGVSRDLDVIRGLLRRYGTRHFQDMVQVASLRDSTISSASSHSYMSNVTSNSRTTSSSLSYYPESVSTGCDPAWAPMMTSVPTTAAVDYHQPNTPHPLAVSDQVRDSDHEANGDGASSSKHQCPLCAEFRHDTRIKRKPDLKRHLLNFHTAEAQWVCKFSIGGGCGMVFDFQAAYDEHCKSEHGGYKNPDAKANLCQQVVFACGFENCREVFVAPSDKEGQATRKIYFEHILSHLGNAKQQAAWSYTRRIRNLLRQDLVHAAWKDCDKDAEQLYWRPETSGVLRKLLECRHVTDASLLCTYAVQLGSNATPPIPPPQLTLPLLNECIVVTTCHHARRDPRFDSCIPNFQPAQSVGHNTIGHTARRQRASVLRPSPSVPAFSYPQEPIPFMPVSTQAPMDETYTMMDDDEALIMDSIPQPLGSIHKPLEYFIGTNEMPSDSQIGPYFDSPNLDLPTRPRTPGRRQLLSRMSFDKLKARRNSGSDGDCRMPDAAPPLPALSSHVPGVHYGPSFEI